MTDSSIAIAEREKVAGLKVERYFDDLIAGKTRLRPLPSALATLLRERMPHSVHEAGVGRAIELAVDIKAKADSAAPKGAMQRPAPRWVPPVPGVQRAGAPPAYRCLRSGRDVTMIRRGYRWPGLPIVLALLGPAAGGLAAQDSTAARRIRLPRYPIRPPRYRARPSRRRIRRPGRRDSTADRSAPAGGAARHGVVVDRVVAVVGNRPVLASQVDEEMFSRQSQGQHLPTIPTRSRPSGSRSSPRSWTRNCWCSRRSGIPPSR